MNSSLTSVYEFEFFLMFSSPLIPKKQKTKQGQSSLYPYSNQGAYIGQAIQRLHSQSLSSIQEYSGHPHSPHLLPPFAEDHASSSSLFFSFEWTGPRLPNHPFTFSTFSWLKFTRSWVLLMAQVFVKIWPNSLY